MRAKSSKQRCPALCLFIISVKRSQHNAKKILIPDLGQLNRQI